MRLHPQEESDSCGYSKVLVPPAKAALDGLFRAPVGKASPETQPPGDLRTGLSFNRAEVFYGVPLSFASELRPGVIHMHLFAAQLPSERQVCPVARRSPSLRVEWRVLLKASGIAPVGRCKRRKQRRARGTRCVCTDPPGFGRQCSIQKER